MAGGIKMKIPKNRKTNADIGEIIEIYKDAKEKFIDPASGEVAIKVSKAENTKKLGGKTPGEYYTQTTIKKQEVRYAEYAGNTEKLNNQTPNVFETKEEIQEASVLYADNAGNTKELSGSNDFLKKSDIDLSKFTAKDSRALGGFRADDYRKDGEVTVKNTLNLADTPAEQYRTKAEMKIAEIIQSDRLQTVTANKLHAQSGILDLPDFAPTKTRENIQILTARRITSLAWVKDTQAKTREIKISKFSVNPKIKHGPIKKYTAEEKEKIDNEINT